jgi:hypothetical protein
MEEWVREPCGLRGRWGGPSPSCDAAPPTDAIVLEQKRPVRSPLRPAGDERRRSWPVSINLRQKLDRIAARISQVRENAPNGHMRNACAISTRSKENAMPKPKKPNSKREKSEPKKDEDAGLPERDKSSWDKVDEAEEESFPASDPPAY